MDASDRLARLAVLVDGAVPTPVADIERAEHILGRPFPAEYRAWLETVGPDATEEFELFLDPLFSDERDDESDEGQGAVVSQGDAFRRWGWGLPDEIVPVGNNGAGELFGLWMPRDRVEPPVVVGFDAGLEEGAELCWIVGSSFLAFLEGWLTVYADSSERVKAKKVWKTLDTPKRLRERDPDEDLLGPMLRHTSPGWPEVSFLWGETAFNVDRLRALLASGANG